MRWRAELLAGKKIRHTEFSATTTLQKVQSIASFSLWFLTENGTTGLYERIVGLKPANEPPLQMDQSCQSQSIETSNLACINVLQRHVSESATWKSGHWESKLLTTVVRSGKVDIVTIHSADLQLRPSPKAFKWSIHSKAVLTCNSQPACGWDFCRKWVDLEGTCKNEPSVFIHFEIFFQIVIKLSMLLSSLPPHRLGPTPPFSPWTPQTFPRRALKSAMALQVTKSGEWPGDNLWRVAYSWADDFQILPLGKYDISNHLIVVGGVRLLSFCYIHIYIYIYICGLQLW